MTSSRENAFLPVLAAWASFCFSSDSLGHPSTLVENAQQVSPPATEPADTSDEPHCHLTVRLVDQTSGVDLPGLIRITTADEQALPLGGLLNRGVMLDQPLPSRQWHVLTEPATVLVPRGPLEIEAFAGLELELVSRRIDLSDREEFDVELSLPRFFDAHSHNLRSGNTHLHLRNMTRAEADRYLQTVPQGDGLEVLFVSHLRRIPQEVAYTTNAYTPADLHRLNTHTLKFGFGEEHRHNLGPRNEGYGHVMLLNLRELIRPVSIGPGLMKEGTDSPSLNRGIRRARQDGATVVWCHQNRGLEDVPNWLLGTLDAQNIFDGTQKFNYESAFYNYLNIGLEVPFSTGTDWFIYDFSRVYVEAPGELTVESWLDALAEGRSFITNGPLLDFSVRDHRPGDVVNLAEPSRVPISGRAVGRHDFKTLQVVHNGTVALSATSRPVGNHFVAEIEAELDLSEPGWIALRTDGKAVNELNGELFSHTSPVYFTLRDRKIFRIDAARALLDDLQTSIDQVIRDAIFSTDEDQAEVIAVYREAIRVLQERIVQEQSE